MGQSDYFRLSSYATNPVLLIQGVIREGDASYLPGRELGTFWVPSTRPRPASHSRGNGPAI